MNHNLEGSDVQFMLSLVDTYRHFAPVPSTEEDMRPAYIMSWCGDMVSAVPTVEYGRRALYNDLMTLDADTIQMRNGMLMADDVLDESPTRRNFSAWHRVGDNNTPVAMRDVIILSHGVHSIIETYFLNEPYFLDLFYTINEVWKVIC